jgi:sugar phosphate isomerase/epimerase
MTPSRREFLAASAVAVGSPSIAKSATATGVGLLSYSYGIRSRLKKDPPLSNPLHFFELAKERGATGVQMALTAADDAAAQGIRKRAEQLELNVEGIVSLPKDAAGQIRFKRELRIARACGASVVRAVVLGGRRYETFSRLEEFREFDRNAREMLKQAESIAKGYRVVLAVENHKDYRAEELADVLKTVSSEFLGICLDTGNNLALLEHPLTTVGVLAKWTRTVHLKDMGLEESPKGFLLSEVPLGEGRLDLVKIVATVREANPKVRLNLEMITRDPLSIPCLTDKYWSTMPAVPGIDLARMITWLRADKRKEPLPKISNRSEQDQLALEDDYVKRSIAYAQNAGW